MIDVIRGAGDDEPISLAVRAGLGGDRVTLGAIQFEGHLTICAGFAAGGVLDAAEVTLHADTRGVVLVGELRAALEVEVVGLDGALDAGEVLQAAALGCIQCVAGDLGYADLPAAAEAGAGGDEGEGDGGVRACRAGVHVHVVPGVDAADGWYRRGSAHGELIVLAEMITRLWLRDHERVEIETKLADVVTELLYGQLAAAGAVKRARVVLVDEVGVVEAGRLAAGLGEDAAGAVAFSAASGGHTAEFGTFRLGVTRPVVTVTRCAHEVLDFHHLEDVEWVEESRLSPGVACPCRCCGNFGAVSKRRGPRLVSRGIIPSSVGCYGTTNHRQQQQKRRCRHGKR